LKRLLMAAAMLSLSGLATAVAPDTLGYQGRLTNGGVAVNGNVTVTFRLYSVASGGLALWTEAQSLPVSNGLYSATLGQSTAFPGSLFTQPLWLGVSLNADPEMTPRQPLTSTPYSQRAKSADTANYASALSVTPTTCGTGQFAQGISAAGNAVGCAAAGTGTVTTVTASAPIASSGGATPNLTLAACSSGQILKHNGSTWACAADANTGGTVTSVVTGAGLTGGPITTTGTIGLASTQQLPTVACASGQVPLWNSSAWYCGNLGTVTGNLNLASSNSASVGNIMKNGVPFIHDYGDGNTFVGENAGNFTMTSNITPPAAITGAYNTAIGGGALTQNTTGAYNTATGLYALTSNQSGGFNTATGQGALQLNTTGSFNTATGQATLVSNTTGYNNTATGQGALQLNTTGNHNTAIGQGALQNNITGEDNTAVGHGALQHNDPGLLVLGGHGHGNTALGKGALQNSSTGMQNTAIGRQAMLNNGLGSFNVGIGADALREMTSGSGNVAIGLSSLVTLTGGTQNIALGAGAGQSLSSGQSNIYIGNHGMASENNTIRIGESGTHTNAYIAGNLYAGSTFVSSSDFNLKTDFEAVDLSTVLERVVSMPVKTWRYKSDPQELRHIGPTAQDFAAAFAVGVDDKHIATVDADGVAFAAIKALYQQLQESDRKSREKDQEIARIKRKASRLDVLEREMAAIKAKLGLR
jgi:hypothetical protein